MVTLYVNISVTYSLSTWSLGSNGAWGSILSRGAGRSTQTFGSIQSVFALGDTHNNIKNEYDYEF